MKLIDKDAVIAEIERLQDSIKVTAINNSISKEQAEAYRVCVKLRSFIEDTLEVKENNLVKELDYNDYMAFFKEHPEYSNDILWGFEEAFEFGQYCYILGLKQQKGE